MTDQTLLPALNLRKIWDQKKSEMLFTQVEAAKDLDWSQGAISHYLNGLTDLGAPAVIKFANFLGVDPTEIDPNIETSLPHVTKINISYHSEDISQPLKNAYLYSRKHSISTYVQLCNETALNLCGCDAQNDFTPSKTIVQLCNVEDHLRADLYAVRLKRKKRLHFYKKKDLPETSKIQRVWAVVGFNTYF